MMIFYVSHHDILLPSDVKTRDLVDIGGLEALVVEASAQHAAASISSPPALAAAAAAGSSQQQREAGSRVVVQHTST